MKATKSLVNTFNSAMSFRAANVTVALLLIFALAACGTPQTVTNPATAAPSNSSVPLSSLPASTRAPAASTGLPSLVPATFLTPVSQTQAYKQLPEITLAVEFKLRVSPLHDQSFFHGGEVRAGEKTRVLATDQNGAWLLVVYDGLLGWMPAMYSNIGVSTLGATVVDSPINPCAGYLGALPRYDQSWESPVNGTVMVEGMIYRPQPARRDDPKIGLRIEGGGQTSTPQLLRKSLGTSSELLIFRAQVDNLQKGARVRMDALDLTNEPFAFLLGVFTKNCSQQVKASIQIEKNPTSSSSQVKQPTSITIVIESGPKAVPTSGIALSQAVTPVGAIASNRGALGQRTNGWIYQYEDSRNSGRLVDFTDRRSYNGLDCYVSPRENYVRICLNGELHPGWTGRVVYRWESNYKGAVNVVVRAQKIDVASGGGDGIGIAAFVGQIGGPPQQIGGFSIGGTDTQGRTESYPAQLSDKSYVLIMIDILGQPEHDQSRVYVDIVPR